MCVCVCVMEEESLKCNRPHFGNAYIFISYNIQLPQTYNPHPKYDFYVFGMAWCTLYKNTHTER